MRRIKPGTCALSVVCALSQPRVRRPPGAFHQHETAGALTRRRRGLRALQPRGWPPSDSYAFDGPVTIAPCHPDDRRVASASHLDPGDHSAIVCAVICYNARCRMCRTCRMRRPAPWRRQWVKRRPVGRITTATEPGPSDGQRGVPTPAPSAALRAGRSASEGSSRKPTHPARLVNRSGREP
jgi:hypothetical protein